MNEKEDRDVRLLREMGYKQELHRGFSPFMSFAFCFTAVNILTSISIGFTYALNTGGSGVTIWAWVIGAIFTILVGCSLAEICSVYPSAGSVYHWAGQLVPEKHAPIASFICGWFNYIGNFAGDVAFASGFAAVVNDVIILSGKESLSTGAIVGIGIAASFVWAVQNALRIDQQGWFNNFAVVLQIASTIVIVVVLLVMAPVRATAHNVFTSTYNSTGFSFPYVCFIGILSTLFSFAGYEAGAHLSEETKKATRAAPNGIICTCVCGALTGFAYLLALLFAIPDVTAFIDSNSGEGATESLAIATYRIALPYPAALAITIILIINVYFAGMSSVTVTTRTGYLSQAIMKTDNFRAKYRSLSLLFSFAMARDGVFPFSKYIRWIFKPTKTPLGNVILVFILNSLLLLLQLVSTTAFSAILSIATIGFQVSYGMPIFFRCTIARRSFTPNEFNLGPFGLPIACIATAWLFITSIIMFFPTEYPVTKDNMNYAVVIVGGVAVIAGVYWFVSARHTYQGPKRVNLDPSETTSDDVKVTDVHQHKLSPSIINVRL